MDTQSGTVDSNDINGLHSWAMQIHRFLEFRLPALYFVTALLIGGIYVCITPSFFAPDETAHAMRGLQVMNGTLLARVSPAGQGDFLDSGFSHAAIYFYELIDRVVRQQNSERGIPRITAEQLRSQHDLRWSGQPVFDSFPMTRIYPPTFYFPASIGWRISQAGRYTIMHSLFLARLCNLLAVAALGWFALLIGKGYRWKIAALLLAPALLALSGSCSQDALIILSAALGIAALSRSFSEKRLPMMWELVLAGTALCAVGMTRPPYLLLLLSLFLPALEMRSFNRRGMLAPLIVALFALTADLSWYLAVKPLGFLVRPGAHPAAQFAFLSRHPIRGLEYVLVGLLRALPVMGSNITEAGSGDVRPSRLIDVLVLMLIAAVFVSDKTPILRQTLSRLLVLFVCIGVSVGMAFAEYIIWTPPATPYSVDGLQIRHFLVLLPLLGLISGFVRRPFAEYAPACLLALAAVDIWIVTLDAHIFYGGGLFSALRLSQFYW